ncbi:hypothetical protein AAF712_003424 [Marasmius tenuissimus]|uniref:C2H2-type domain-containing protein n=1 Tax=Marasmius tenuissimus TaxID=585030 RepID=A0ABR3A8W7_9AGAR
MTSEYCQRCKASVDDLNTHKQRSNVHWKCNLCNRDLRTETGLRDHKISIHSCCRECNRFFSTEGSLEQHYRDSPKHNYCVQCGDDFQTENNLKQHLKSSHHQSPNIKCWADRCTERFLSHGDLYLHLEGGGCPSGINRAILNREFKRYPKGSKFTVPPSELKTKPDCASVNANKCWNGSAYECPFCDDSTFSKVGWLKQHLASPHHEAKAYRCPSCPVRASNRFPALSALRQHIDSESCDAHKQTSIVEVLDGKVGNIVRSM